ncbi:TPA: hypothetical protein EYQ19_00005, partial [Candidatus Pacearchaeota archaeon]|nr:hypothetical protein [Candidatus Pacearchaeota archaeon]
MKKELWLVIGVVAIVLAVVVNTGDIGLGPRGGQVDGDVNGDGSFGLGDLMALISYLFGNGPSIDLRAADMNGDRAVDITDVSIMANLLSQSSPPAKSMVGPSPPCTSNCIDGDANGDGFLTISDPIYLLNALLVPGSPGLNCLGSSDANGDGVINLADSIYLLNYLFSGGPDSAECFTMITFETTFDGADNDNDRGHSVQLTSEGGYIITGYTTGFLNGTNGTNGTGGY